MTTNDSLLWGDREEFNSDAINPVFHTTRQLVNVQAPMPCTWQLWFVVDAPGAFAGAVIPTVKLSLGIGRFLQELTLKPTVPDNPFLAVQEQALGEGRVLFVGRATLLPSTTILGRMNLFTVAAHPGSWRVSLWTGPQIPWQGIEVIPTAPSKPVHSLAEASAGFDHAREVWRNR